MITSIDERKGLIKVYWRDVRNRVAKVNPVFAKLIDDVSPDKTFPLYLAYYPYGALIDDARTPFLPRDDGSVYRLTKDEAPADVFKHLGYGQYNAPLGILLEKQMESFITLPGEKTPIPSILALPGTISPFAPILRKKNSSMYAPNGLMAATSGARSVFMLPNIGCMGNHANLQRDFGIKSLPPKFLYQHWGLFKEIINSEALTCDWKMSLLLFSEKWIEKIKTDPAWMPIKLYIHELAWDFFNFWSHQASYNVTFSYIQKIHNLKPNPYLVDTAKHFFAILTGHAPAYAPACDEEALPINLLNRAFVESYNLKKYHSIIMQPTNFVSGGEPVYYSLQQPSTLSFSPTSRRLSCTLYDMHELIRLVDIFKKDLSRDNFPCSDTVLSIIARIAQFDYFHTKKDSHNIIKLSKELAENDPRFHNNHSQYKVESATIPYESPFVRGCIRLSTSKTVAL